MKRVNLRTAQPREAAEFSETAAWRLLDMAYADPSPLWAYLALCSILGAIAFVCMHNLPSAVWAGSGFILAVARLMDWHGHKGRRATGRLRHAQRRFTVMATLNGLFWGSANLVLVLSHDVLLQFWIINAETAVVSLAVGRLSAMGAAIKIQVVISMVSLILCCLATENPYFQGYAILALLYLLALLSMVRDLHGKTVRLLLADEENAALLRRGADTNAQLAVANSQLEAMATTDALTGIPNRRLFDETIRKEWGHAARGGTTLSMLLIDIDKFKFYNDTLGHPAGDACLRRVAAALASALRGPSDLAARYGGEEFAVIIAGADYFETMDIAERLRSAVEDLALPAPSGNCVTVSVGAAIHEPSGCPAAIGEEGGDGIAALIAKADIHLYEAKRSGRNCVRAGMAPPSGSYSCLEYPC